MKEEDADSDDFDMETSIPPKFKVMNAKKKEKKEEDEEEKEEEEAEDSEDEDDWEEVEGQWEEAGVYVVCLERFPKSVVNDHTMLVFISLVSEVIK